MGRGHGFGQRTVRRLVGVGGATAGPPEQPSGTAARRARGWFQTQHVSRAPPYTGLLGVLMCGPPGRNIHVHWYRTSQARPHILFHPEYQASPKGGRVLAQDVISAFLSVTAQTWLKLKFVSSRLALHAPRHRSTTTTHRTRHRSTFGRSSGPRRRRPSMQEIVAEPRWRKEKARLAKLPAGGGG